MPTVVISMALKRVPQKRPTPRHNTIVAMMDANGVRPRTSVAERKIIALHLMKISLMCPVKPKVLDVMKFPMDKCSKAARIHFVLIEWCFNYLPGLHASPSTKSCSG
jgi:hypothetical protein